MDRRARRKVRWVLGLGCILGAYLVLVFLFRGPRYFISPDRIRESERRYFDESFDGGVPAKLKSLREDPPPEFETKVSDDEIRVVYVTEYDRPEEELPVFFADTKGEVKLPGGVSIRLAGMALWRSWEFDMEGVSPREYDLEWKDPISGGEIDDVDWKPFPYVANKKEQGPNLLLRFSVSDSNLVTPGDKVKAYNSQNLSKVSSIGYHSLRPHYTYGEYYWIYLHAWNQHSVRVSMEVYFGAREIQSFPEEVGEKIRFGEHAEIELLAKSNQFIGGNTTTYGHRGLFSAPEKKFPLEAPLSGNSVHNRIYRLWPPEIASHFQFRRGAEEAFGAADFSDVFIRSSEDESDFKSMQISWMGERARLVFDIPVLPDLPVVENQFETPMPLVYFSEPKDIINEVGQATELRINLNKDYPAPTDEFPMIIRDTTPVKLIKLYEEISGAPLYYKRETGEITDVRPEGVIDKVIEWVKQKATKGVP